MFLEKVEPQTDEREIHRKTVYCVVALWVGVVSAQTLEKIERQHERVLRPVGVGTKGEQWTGPAEVHGGRWTFFV